MRDPEISIVLPCRNEEKALPFCLKKIKEVIKKNHLSAEIIVSDSSSDKSPEIAKRAGVVLVKHDKEGYGNAYIEGIKVARGKYIVMADADGTYDLSKIPEFVQQLENGHDLVIGDRFSGNMEKNAMPFSNKYIGNPVLSGLLRLFFGTKIKDCHCGMRAIKRSSFDKLNLKTTGMEFASEMIIKALKNKLKISQIPIDYKKRIGRSKLRKFGDGWRHLRFMLLYSPLFLFFIPGTILFSLGFILTFLLYVSKLNLFGISFYVHPLFLFSAMMIVGYQLMFFAFFSKVYSITHLGEENKLIQNLFRYFSIEKGILFGGLLLLLGVLAYIFIFSKWVASGLGDLNETKSLIIALTFVVLGFQTIFSAFMLSILGIKEK